MRAKGFATFCDPGADRPLLELGTAQCCHCGGHFPIRPGSGTIRGFCQQCNGPVCGRSCEMCVPTEQLLENMEKGRAWDFRPIVVGVSFSPED